MKYGPAMAEDDRTRRVFAPLLGALCAAFAVEGVAGPGRWEQLAITILVGATLLLALQIAAVRPSVLRGAALVVALVAAASLTRALEGRVDDRSVRIANGLLVAVAPPAVFLGVVRELRGRGAVTLDTVLGVLCAYMLLGMFFASLYGAIDRVGGAPFFAHNAPGTTAHFLYFSFTTLATLGYGDLVARSNLGHTLSVAEALIGQIYLVTIVSLIVSNLGRRRSTEVVSSRGQSG